MGDIENKGIRCVGRRGRAVISSNVGLAGGWRMVL